MKNYHDGIWSQVLYCPNVYLDKLQTVRLPLSSYLNAHAVHLRTCLTRGLLRIFIWPGIFSILFISIFIFFLPIFPSLFLILLGLPISSTFFVFLILCFLQVPFDLFFLVFTYLLVTPLRIILLYWHLH